MPGDCLTRERQDCVRTDGGIPGDYAVLLDEESRRSGECAVCLGELPSLLNYDGKLETVLIRLVPVLLLVASAHDQHSQAVFSILLMQAHQVRRQLIARAAAGLGEDQKHAPTSVVFQ